MSGLVGDRGEWFLQFIPVQFESLVTRQESCPSHEDCFWAKGQTIHNHMILCNFFIY